MRNVALAAEINELNFFIFILVLLIFILFQITEFFMVLVVNYNNPCLDQH